MTLAGATGIASARPDQCVSTNGQVRVQRGDATCVSGAGSGNVAIAKGAGSFAEAGTVPGDSHDRATATGVGSVALAYGGSGNTATASGHEGSIVFEAVSACCNCLIN